MAYFSNIVKSFLGPNKCMKFVIDEDQVEAVSCPAEYLSILPYQNSLSQFVNSSVQSHHEKYITGTTTLISYIDIFNNIINDAIKRGNNSIDICKNLTSDLEYCTKYLKTKSYSLKNKLKTKKNDVKHQIPSSMHRILSQSRHLSYLINDENEDFKLNDLIMDKMKEIVQSVCHNEHEREISDLITKAWINQVQQRNCEDFTLDPNRIEILSILGNSISNRVISGILIKIITNKLFLTPNKLWRSLFISGNLTYDYNHRGYNESVKSKLILTSFNMKKLNPTLNWIEFAMNKLIMLRVNLVLVQGSVDDKFETECFSKGILVISNVNDRLLRNLSKSLSIPIENYILDCDETNVVSDISIELLRLDSIKNDNYILFKVPNELQTLIICSSCTPLTLSKQHYATHLVQRLSSCLSSAIDGGGKAEEDGINYLKSVDKGNSLLIDVFNHFINLLRENCNLCQSGYSTVDAFLPKIEAWNSALQIVVTLVNTDAIVLIGEDKSLWECVKQCKYNFVGYL